MLRRTRSPEPIEGLFVAHFGSIYRFAACRVGRDAALDIAAETFAQALRSAARLDTEPESHIDPRAIPVTRADVLKVEAEIEKIVGSIRFG